jgi:hypothetical protein
VLVACPKDGVWFCGVGAPLSLGHTFSDWCFLIDLFLFLWNILSAHFLHRGSALLKSFEFCKGGLFGVGGIVCQKEQLLEIVLFSFEAGLNAGQLAVVSHSFLFEASHHLLIGLLHCLRLVEFYHHSI